MTGVLCSEMPFPRTGLLLKVKQDFPLHIYYLSTWKHRAVKPNQDLIEELLGCCSLGLDAHATCLSFAFSFL